MNTAQNIQKSPAAAAGFDLDILDTVDTSKITFNVDVVLDDEGNGISGFTCVGKNSPQYIAITDIIRQEGIKRSAKRNKPIDTATDEGAQFVSKTMNSNELRIALAVTTGWYGFNKAGAAMEFDVLMLEKMLTKFPTWLQAISAKLDTEGNFPKV